MSGKELVAHITTIQEDRELKLAVRHLVEMNDLRIKQANEWKELLQLQTLEKKYV